MRLVIPDDYQDCVRHLDCFKALQDHEVTIFNDTVSDIGSLVKRFAGAQGIVLTRERTRISAELLDHLPDLRIISQTGKIAPHIDLAACTHRGVAVAEGSGTGAATAELTWALILASRRHLFQEANGLRAGRWQSLLGQQLQGQQLGVWGYGRIGQQVAAYGKAFGMQVTIWGRARSREQALADGYTAAPSQAAFFEHSDVLTLHLRLTDETRGIVAAADLAAMKTTALLVNTSRAELIAPNALEAALQRGRPGFAAVDVFESEPVLDAAHPLLQLPNALCTPHLGFVEKDNYEHYYGTAFANINHFAAGNLTGLVNPEVKPRTR
jgi:D-3-phosphoglycerate dehydrogenase